jgi:hypothetical protein
VKGKKNQKPWKLHENQDTLNVFSQEKEEILSIVTTEEVKQWIS